MSQYYHFKSTLTQNKKDQAMALKEFTTSHHTHNPRKLQPTKVIDSIKRRHQPSGLFRRRPICGSSSGSTNMADNGSRFLTAYYVQHHPDNQNARCIGGLQHSNQLDCAKKKQLNEPVRWTPRDNIQVYSLHEGRKASERSKKLSKALKPQSKGVSFIDFLTCKQKSPKKSAEKKPQSIKKDSASTKSRKSAPKTSDASRKQITKSPKLSWDNKIKVRYTSSDLANKKRPKKPMVISRRASLEKVNKDENVVHLKIQVPKPDETVKKALETSGQESDRLVDILREELLTNAVRGKSEPMSVEEAGAIIKLLTKNEPEKSKLPSAPNAQQRNPNVDLAYPMSNVMTGDSGEGNKVSIINNTFPPGEVIGISTSPDEHYFGAYKKAADTVEKPMVEKPPNTKLVEHKPQDKKDEEKPPIIYKEIGVSAKQGQKVGEAASECNCHGATAAPNNIFDKIRNSINMTDSDNAVFDKITNPTSDPAYTGKRTKYGNVTVETHNPICDCEICASFGTVELLPTNREAKNNSNDRLVISEKVVRVLHNNGYRNIVTHTEDCNCKICKSIKEHVLNSPPARPYQDYQVSQALEDDMVYSQRYPRMGGRLSGFQRPSFDENRRFAKEHKDKKSTDSKKVTHKLVVPHCCATDLLKHYRPPVRHSPEHRRVNPTLVGSSSDNSDSSEDYSSRDSRGGNRRQRNHSSKPFDYRISNRLYDLNTYKNRNRGMDDDDGFGEFQSEEEEKPHQKFKSKRSSCLSCSSQTRGSHKNSRRKPSLALHPAIVEESISTSMRSEKRSDKADHRKPYSSHKSSRSSKRRRQSIVNSVRILGTSTNANLQNIIKDLVKGQPLRKDPKLNTLTLGHMENAPYSSIKIVNYANPNIQDFFQPGCSLSLPQTSVIEETNEHPSHTRESCPSVLEASGGFSPSSNCSSRSPFGYETDTAFHMQSNYSNTANHQMICGERRNYRLSSCDSPALSNSSKTTNLVPKPNKLMVRFSKLFKGKSKKC